MTIHRTTYKLSDEFIFQTAKLLQLAILTDTDLVDQFRQMRLESKDGMELSLTPEYTEWFNNQLAKMLAEAEELAKKQQQTILT